MQAKETAILRDGKVVALCETTDDAFVWLLNHQGQSFHYTTTYGGYEIETIAPWPDDKRRYFSATARRCLIGDESHRRGDCKRYGQTARRSCGTFALLGYEPRGGWEEGTSVKHDGPNHAGWARIYVEGGWAIPEHWRDAFTRERESDNLAYAHALERSIATYGVKFR